jgi:hypothetical protein
MPRKTFKTEKFQTLSYGFWSFTSFLHILYDTGFDVLPVTHKHFISQRTSYRKVNIRRTFPARTENILWVRHTQFLKVGSIGKEWKWNYVLINNTLHFVQDTHSAPLPHSWSLWSLLHRCSDIQWCQPSHKCQHSDMADLNKDQQIHYMRFLQYTCEQKTLLTQACRYTHIQTSN